MGTAVRLAQTKRPIPPPLQAWAGADRGHLSRLDAAVRREVQPVGGSIARRRDELRPVPTERNSRHEAITGWSVIR
jgi:hypothetical protein